MAGWSGLMRIPVGGGGLWLVMWGRERKGQFQIGRG